MRRELLAINPDTGQASTPAAVLIIRTLADAAAIAADSPNRKGELALRLDNGALYEATGTTAGAWTAADPATIAATAAQALADAATAQSAAGAAAGAAAAAQGTADGAASAASAAAGAASAAQSTANSKTTTAEAAAAALAAATTDAKTNPSKLFKADVNGDFTLRGLVASFLSVINTGGKKASLTSAWLTADRAHALPNAAGVLALVANSDGKIRVSDVAIDPQTLTDAATITYNCPDGFNAVVTLGASRTLAAITNAPAGSSGTLWVVQGGSGFNALTLDASQIDMLGTLADIEAMDVGGVAVIAWTTRNGTSFNFFITGTPT